MLVIGLTGGIATGKSTVSAQFAKQGIPLIDADVLARQVVEPGTRAYKQIVAHFGPDILREDGYLDRPKLGQVVFSDEQKRKKLNSIVHPAVSRAMVWQVLKYWLAGHKLCLLDIPLLVEVGLYKWVGKVIVVYCSKEIQLQRLMARDKSTAEAASARLAAQLPIVDKLKLADQVIDNSGTVSDLQKQVSSSIQKLNEEAGWFWMVSWILPPIGIASAAVILSWRAFIRSRRK
ncbi:CoaE-domain-containing protein [Sistotremastrum suecicum HHB10207 ss-3]|uniref:CoaE-domain-containing protein n=1 Tax=Sistotremastrum suecicum HHB10207 ss-3 TaxID=1314776 RepID=A0A166IRY4_9AGAM|nr:CoaE-domain-containing protein [Sistotremastrum suecicum HHB10207 ss-3]